MDIRTVDQYILSKFTQPLSDNENDNIDFKKILDDAETCEEYVVQKLLYLEGYIEELHEQVNRSETNELNALRERHMYQQYFKKLFNFLTEQLKISPVIIARGLLGTLDWDSIQADFMKRNNIDNLSISSHPDGEGDLASFLENAADIISAEKLLKVLQEQGIMKQGKSNK